MSQKHHHLLCIKVNFNCSQDKLKILLCSEESNFDSLDLLPKKTGIRAKMAPAVAVLPSNLERRP